MSAEPRRTTDAEAWAQWENHVVNGVFPLRRVLGCSNHSAVFLTEYKAKNLADAAIKFVRADALQAKGQLVQWGAAATLSHPHLVRLFEVGRCQLGGQEFLFVVMEYADQTLAQILHQRALSPDEARELLLPALGALAFLHQKRLVHGQLRPSNFLAVGDQLKLTGDTVRPAGRSAKGSVRTSAYDPPELQDGEISTASDVWSLGMTLVEALTQRTTAWPDQSDDAAALPASFPVSFVDTVLRCLNLTPASRPSALELEAEYKPASQAQPISVPQPSTPETPRAPEPPREVIPPQNVVSRPPALELEAQPKPAPQARSIAVTQASAPATPRAVTPSQNVPKRNLTLPAIAAVLLISLAVWIGWRSADPSQAQLQPPDVSAPAPVAPSTIAESTASSPASGPQEQLALPPPTTPLTVLHEVTPEVPPAIQRKIRGRVYVTVRVLVDESGAVVGALLENPGPSKYFARLADTASREWQFAPAENLNARVWLLRFEFTRDGVTARATAQ